MVTRSACHSNRTVSVQLAAFAQPSRPAPWPVARPRRIFSSVAVTENCQPCSESVIAPASAAALQSTQQVPSCQRVQKGSHENRGFGSSRSTTCLSYHSLIFFPRSSRATAAGSDSAAHDDSSRAPTAHAGTRALTVLHSCSNNSLTSSLAAGYGGGTSFLPRAAARTLFSVPSVSL